MDPKRVLLVEDDDQFLELFTMIVRPWRTSITTTSAGYQAVQLLSKNEYDLVVADVQLSDDGGFELLTAIAQQPLLAKRSLIMTAFPLIGQSWSDLPVIDKTRLHELGPHLLRILGAPDNEANNREPL